MYPVYFFPPYSQLPHTGLQPTPLPFHNLRSFTLHRSKATTMSIRLSDLSSREPDFPIPRESPVGPPSVETSPFFAIIDIEKSSPTAFEDQLVTMFKLNHLHLYSTRTTDPISTLDGETEEPKEDEKASDKKEKEIPHWAKNDTVTGHTVLTYMLTNPTTVTFDRVFILLSYYEPLVNRPLFYPSSQQFKSLPLLLALRHGLELDIIQLLIRHGAYLLCFDQGLRFPLHYLCQNYIYRIDTTFARDFLLKCQEEITKLNLKHRVLNGFEYENDGVTAVISSSVEPEAPKLASSSTATTDPTPTVTTKSLLPQAQIGFPPSSVTDRAFDFALLEPQNINELINMPPAWNTKGANDFADVANDGQYTPLESAIISASKCLLSPDIHYTVSTVTSEEGDLVTMAQWIDPLEKSHRASTMIDVVRLLIDHSDNVTAEAIFDYQVPEDDTDDIIDENDKELVLKKKATDAKLDKAADLANLPPTQRYPQLTSVHTNPLAVAMDVFASNTEWGLRIIPALLFQGQTRPRPARHLTLPTTYRYIILYYSSLSLPHRPRFNSGLLSALFFHSNPLIHTLFRLGLTKPPTPSDVRFHTSMLHATVNLHRLLTLLQHIPNSLKQEAIFQRLYEQTDAFSGSHRTKGSPGNPWVGTILSNGAKRRLLTFGDVHSFDYGVDGVGLIENTNPDGDIADKSFYKPLPPHLLFDLFQSQDEMFQASMSPELIESFSKQKYLQDIAEPYTVSNVQNILHTHHSNLAANHNMFIQWSSFSIYPNKSRVEIALKPTRESCGNNDTEYRKQFIEYRDKHDVTKRTPYELSRVNLIAKYGPELHDLQTNHHTLCNLALKEHDFATAVIKNVNTPEDFVKINPYTKSCFQDDENVDQNGKENSSLDLDPHNALTSSILFQYYSIWSAWRNYFVENPFIGNVHDEDLFRSPAIRKLLSETTSVESFFLKHYPHSYDKFVSTLPGIDCFSPDTPKGPSETYLSGLNDLYKSYYNLSPIVTSSIQPFPAANNAPIITLQLLDFISIISSGVLFRQPVELLNPPTSEQFIEFLHSLFAQQEALYNAYTPEQILSLGDEAPKPCLNPITIPQPGMTSSFNRAVPPGLFWWAIYYCSVLSFDDVILLCQNCRTDILNHDWKSLLMVAIAKHWPLENLLPLVKATININQRDIEGRTVLHFLFMTGAYMSIPELLDILVFEYGAVLNIVDSHGHTPLSYAVFTQAPEDVLIKLINYTLLRTPKQYEVYYQFFEPRLLEDFTPTYVNPTPHFSQFSTYSEPDDKLEDHERRALEKKRRAANCRQDIILPSIAKCFTMQKGLLYFQNRASMSVDQFIATTSSFDSDQIQQMRQGSHLSTVPPPPSMSHQSCIIPVDYMPYLNYPMNVNFLTHTVYANDATLPFIIVDSAFPSTSFFAPGTIPDTQICSQNISTRQSSVLSGGTHSDIIAMTGGLFLSIHECMLRCHTPLPVIQHLIAMVSFGLAATGALNPNNDSNYQLGDKQEVTMQPKIASSSLPDDSALLYHHREKAMNYLFNTLPTSRVHRAEEAFEMLYNLIGPGCVNSVSSLTPIDKRIVYGVHMLTGVDKECYENDPNVGAGAASNEATPPDEGKEDENALSRMQSSVKRKLSKEKKLTKMTREQFLICYVRANKDKLVNYSRYIGIDTIWNQWKHEFKIQCTCTTSEEASQTAEDSDCLSIACLFSGSF